MATHPPPGEARDPGLFPALAKAVYLAAALLVLLWFSFRIRNVLLFFTLALVLAVGMNAPVTWLTRRKVSRGLATAVVGLAVLATVALLGALVIPPLAREVAALARNAPQLALALSDRVAALLARVPELEGRVRTEALSVSQLGAWVPGLLRGVWSYGFSLLGALLLGLLLFSVVLYMVSDPRPLLEGYVEALPPHLRGPAARAFTRGSQATVGWMAANVVLGTLKAVPAFLFLYFLGIPNALVWSVLAFFSVIVPRLGFYVMAVPPVLVALSVSPLKALWVAAFFWAWSELVGNFVAPRVQASTMRLHPVFLLFVMMAMGAAFGVVGVLIATPVAGFAKAYYDELFLARRPPDPYLEERVEAMLHRRLPADG